MSNAANKIDMEPGVYENIPFVDYIRINAVSASTLKAIAVSPLYWSDQPPFDPVSSLIGRAGHTAVLEPMQFLREYALYDKRRAGKEYDAFKEANANKSILNEREYQLALDMQAGIKRHPVASSILYAPGRRTELTVVWKDDRTGTMLKSRLDMSCDTHDADLKTTASLEKFHGGRYGDIQRYHYDIQGAMYSIAGMIARGGFKPFYFVGVEKKQPFDVRVIELTSRDFDIANEKFNDALDTYNRCRAVSEWPGRYPDVEAMNLPDPSQNLSEVEELLL